MKAMVYRHYGLPEVLALEEVPKPEPADDEVLVKVRAASINSWDWDLLTGKPIAFRLFGLFKPKYTIGGADIAGVVEAVGKDVQAFEAGDEVFGDLSVCGFGGYAEYVSVPERALAKKSSKLSFEEAAAVPQAGVLALQGLRDHRDVEAGDQVLINGAGGGVGTFAVQLAKSDGAEVTAVDGAVKLDLLRELGADHVIDYARADYTRSGKRYDLILDMVANRSVFDYGRVLNPGGAFVMVGATPSRILRFLISRPFVPGKFGVLAHKPNPGDFARLNELIEAGKTSAVVDKVFPLSELPAAFRYFDSGQFRGKVVITI